MHREGEDYIVHVSGAIAIAKTVAYISELIDLIAIFPGLTRRSMAVQSFKFLLLGEGKAGCSCTRSSYAIGRSRRKRMCDPTYF